MSRYLGDFILPEINRHNRAWFTSGKLQVQSCGDCGHLQHPPDDVCYNCAGTSLGMRELAGTGSVESAVVVRHPTHPDLADRVPYVVAVISMDGAPGCNAIGNILNTDPEKVKIGDTVRVVYEPADGELLLPQWEPA
jgi:uncharacterized OB-fold protein